MDSDAGAAALLHYFKNEVEIKDPSIFKKRAPETKMKLNNLIGVVLEMTLSINFYHLIQSLGTMERTLDRYL